MPQVPINYDGNEIVAPVTFEGTEIVARVEIDETARNGDTITFTVDDISGGYRVYEPPAAEAFEQLQESVAFCYSWALAQHTGLAHFGAWE